MLYVRDGMRHKEFYEYGLVSGIHYVAVDILLTLTLTLTLALTLTLTLPLTLTLT